MFSVKHFAVSSQEPACRNSKFTNHRLEPGDLKPATVWILSLCYQISPVNIIEPTICVHATYGSCFYQSIQPLVETIHYLFAHLCSHLFPRLIATILAAVKQNLLCSCSIVIINIDLLVRIVMHKWIGRVNYQNNIFAIGNILKNIYSSY